MGWVVVWKPNPGDVRPISWRWDGPEVGGKLGCSSTSLIPHVEHLATVMDPVYATPTGPTYAPDLTVSWLAFQVVWEMGMRAGLEPEDMEVRGDGWQIPKTNGQAPPGVLF